MAGVNIKMGVTGVSEFKKGMKEAESAVSTLNSALKLNESELKATGNQEQFLVNKTKILKDAIEKQTEAVRQAEQALATMRTTQVDQTSVAFQQMQKKVYESQKKLADLKTELKATETGAKDAGTALEGIGKNVSWDNVAEGLGKINDQLMNAGRAAVNFGKKISRSVMSSAEWADQLKTTAEMWDLTPERLQRMQNVAEIVDTDVDAILTAQARMSKAATTSGGIKAIEETLGLRLNGQSADDLFWEIGDALLNMENAFDRESAAQQVFGRSWRELVPLFKTGREEYEKMLADQKVMSDEDVYKLGDLDDMIQGLKQQVELIKNQFIADNADKIQGFLQWLVDNADGVKNALVVIGAGFAALKVAEVAANIGKVISGMQSLGLISGSGGTAAAAAAGGSAGTGIGVLLGTILEKATPIAAAYAASQAFDPGKSEAGMYVKELHSAVRSGTMTADEAQSAILMHDFGVSSLEEMQRIMSEESVEIPIEPKAQDGAAEDLAAQVGTVTLPANLVVTDLSGLGGSNEGHGFANGLPWVPFDGFPAILHKGERVLTASENRNYTYNSNNYFGSVNLNNGQDIEALCDSIDRHNRRRQSGFGE